MKIKSMRKQIQMIVFSALATILMFIAIPIIPLAPFLTVDISDVSLLLLAQMTKRRYALVGSILSALLYWSIQAFSLPVLIGLIGHLVFTWTYICSYPKIKSLWKQIILQFIVSVLANIFFLLPAYEMLLHFELPYSLCIYLFCALLPYLIVKTALVHWIVHECQKLPFVSKKERIG